MHVINLVCLSKRRLLQETPVCADFHHHLIQRWSRLTIIAYFLATQEVWHIYLGLLMKMKTTFTISMLTVMFMVLS